MISGSGLAMAKMIGFGAIDWTMSARQRALGREAEEDVGARPCASASVRASVSTACADFHWFMPSVRPW